jgi:hypothetical protein
VKRLDLPRNKTGSKENSATRKKKETEFKTLNVREKLRRVSSTLPIYKNDIKFITSNNLMFLPKKKAS